LKKLIISLSFIVAIILAEVVLTCSNIFKNDFYTAPPNSGFVWKLQQGDLPGISGDSQVQFDNLGSRSTISLEDNHKKVIAIGGSTTACFALTQTKTWTALLQQKLGADYWIGNFGRPGNSSNHHVQQIEHLLDKKKLNDANTVIIMQGVNDFIGYITFKDRYLNSTDYEIRELAFKHIPNKYLPFPQNINLYKLFKRVKQKLIRYTTKESTVEKIFDFQSLRQNADLIDTLPDLNLGLDHYTKNINKIIAIAKINNVNLIFTTQPVLWRENLEPELEKRIIACGFDGDSHFFYNTKVMSEGMAAFNKRLFEVCKSNKITCLQLSQPTEIFYDDVHFNELGAELISDQITSSIK